MALDIKKLDEQQHTISYVVAEQKLWLTADGERLVPDGHPEAAVLYCTPGKRIPRGEAARYGLLKGAKQRVAAGDKGEAPDYSKLKQPQLKAELAKRGIDHPKGAVKNAVLVKLLQADDAKSD